MVMKWHYM